MTLERLLRQVDGWPHVLFGPVLLIFSGRIAKALGVHEGALVAFVLAFTLYGVVVVLGVRRGGVPRWLAALAIGMNGLFVMAVATSLAVSDVTTFGTVLHAALILNGVAVTAMLIRLSRTRVPPAT